MPKCETKSAFRRTQNYFDLLSNIFLHLLVCHPTEENRAAGKRKKKPLAPFDPNDILSFNVLVFSGAFVLLCFCFIPNRKNQNRISSIAREQTVRNYQTSFPPSTRLWEKPPTKNQVKGGLT